MSAEFSGDQLNDQIRRLISVRYLQHVDKIALVGTPHKSSNIVVDGLRMALYPKVKGEMAGNKIESDYFIGFVKIISEGDPAKDYKIFNQVSKSVWNSLNDKVDIAQQEFAIEFSQEEQIPVAALVVGELEETHETVVLLYCVQGMNPRLALDSFEKIVYQKFARLN